MGLENWVRVTPHQHCPICDKPDWCLIAKDGTAALCQRIDSEDRKGDAGWLHRLSDVVAPLPPRVGRRTPPPKKRFDPRYGRMSLQFEKAMTIQLYKQVMLTLKIGYTFLQRMRVGWDGEAFTFPMVDGTLRTTGIRRRLLNGKRLAVTGGKDGVFLPMPFTQREQVGRIVVCEGPTDTASMISMGIRAIGRPACATGGAIVHKLLTRWRTREVYIFADNDKPGMDGAERLAVVLAQTVARVHVVSAPEGCKDARDWVRQRSPTYTDLEVLAGWNGHRKRREPGYGEY